MRKLFIFIISLFIFSAAQAQSSSANSSTYRTALGVKVWDGGGISFKHFLNDRGALELIGYFWNRGTRITGLYEIHGPISGAQGLQWYIGPGAHIGFYNTKYGDGSFIGLDGVIGLDYKFSGAPINISLDWQPSFEFGDNRGFVSSWEDWEFVIHFNGIALSAYLIQKGSLKRKKFQLRAIENLSCTEKENLEINSLCFSAPLRFSVG